MIELVHLRLSNLLINNFVFRAPHCTPTTIVKQSQAEWTTINNLNIYQLLINCCCDAVYLACNQPCQSSTTKFERFISWKTTKMNRFRKFKISSSKRTHVFATQKERRTVSSSSLSVVVNKKLMKKLWNHKTVTTKLLESFMVGLGGQTTKLNRCISLMF